MIINTKQRSMAVCYNCGGNHYARNCPTGFGDLRPNSYCYYYLRAMKKLNLLTPRQSPLETFIFQWIFNKRMGISSKGSSKMTSKKY